MVHGCISMASYAFGGSAHTDLERCLALTGRQSPRVVALSYFRSMAIFTLTQYPENSMCCTIHSVTSVAHSVTSVAFRGWARQYCSEHGAQRGVSLGQIIR